MKRNLYIYGMSALVAMAMFGTVAIIVIACAKDMGM